MISKKKTGLTSCLLKFWSHFADSNRRPTHYECVALPTELKWRSVFEAANIQKKSYLCTLLQKLISEAIFAVIAQLVERQLPKLQVAGSRPVIRSKIFLK